MEKIYTAVCPLCYSRHGFTIEELKLDNTPPCTDCIGRYVTGSTASFYIKSYFTKKGFEDMCFNNPVFADQIYRYDLEECYEEVFEEIEKIIDDIEDEDLPPDILDKYNKWFDNL